MPDFLVVALAVLFVLGVAINIHEFGHFAVAKILGMRVEAYSFFGLGPRIWGFKKGDTDYRISAIPLGAYVKLYGDEATASLEGGESDGEEVPESELYELRPRWQKFLVMMGGPFMNVILALAIPFGMAMAMGVPSVSAPIVGYVTPNGAAAKAGIEKGDRIVGYLGEVNPTWQRVEEDTILIPGKASPITVLRDGKRIDLTVTPATREINGQELGDLQMAPDMGVEPVVVGMIQDGMPAASSDLRVGDEIKAVNGKPVRNQQDAKTYILEAGESPVVLTVMRGEEQLDISMQSKKVGEARMVGIAFSNSSSTFDRVGMIGAANFAFDFNWRILRLTGKAFGQVFSGEKSIKQGGIAGPVGIVQQIALVVRQAGFIGLLPLLAMISLSLGLFNLLPIPLLDGGQIAMLGIDKVLSWFGMSLTMAIKEKIQLAGLAIILFLMVMVMYIDISRIMR